MLKTIRTEQIGKFTLRLLQSEDGYVGAVIGGAPLPHVHGDDPEQVWRKLRAEGFHEQVDEQPLDSLGVMADPVIAGRLMAGELQPVQRRLAGERRAIAAPGGELARQHRQHRIVAQLVMVHDILITERDADHPLADQRSDLMLDQFGPARIMNAGGEAIHQAHRPIRGAQEQRAGIRRRHQRPLPPGGPRHWQK